MAEKNLAQQQKEFEYQQKLNEMTMQREDTAIQRQVEDYEAAGLNKLLAAGGSGSSASSLSTYSSAGADANQVAPQINLQGGMELVGGITDYIQNLRQSNAEIQKTQEETNYIKGQINQQDTQNNILEFEEMLKAFEAETIPEKRKNMLEEFLKNEIERKQLEHDYNKYKGWDLPSNSPIPQEIGAMKILLSEINETMKGKNKSGQDLNQILDTIFKFMKESSYNWGTDPNFSELGRSAIDEHNKNNPNNPMLYP